MTALAVGLLCLGAPAAGVAAGARVDRSFGTNGTAGTVLPPRYETEGVNRLTPEADGGCWTASAPGRRSSPSAVTVGRSES